ncbi:hypothetical protein BU17DRAFT_81328 [Hysterangium stoloniferum]|nr:hypothetical protein BU17DRAFT_81328 [Hysterangium stoloniferum]
MPQNPAIYNDIAYTHQYLEGLIWISLGNVVQNPATDHEVGLAEACPHLPVCTQSCWTPWLQAFQANIQQNFQQLQQNFQKMVHDIAGINNGIALLQQEQPILLANSQAGTKGPLYNSVQNGWVLLAAPNPAS